MANKIHVVLTGNPNSGKTSLFNALTGLNHKVGNFPGVTVDKRSGNAFLTTLINAEITDIPGTYSLYPKSKDEEVANEALLDEEKRADVVVVVVDASNLKRSLFYCSQVLDLKMPTVIALTMLDTAEKKGYAIDSAKLSEILGAPVVGINPRRGSGLEKLKTQIALTYQSGVTSHNSFYDIPDEYLEKIKTLGANQKIDNNYRTIQYLHLLHRSDQSSNSDHPDKSIFPKSDLKKLQSDEVLKRYATIDKILTTEKINNLQKKEEQKLLTAKIDAIVLHPVWGLLLMLTVLLFIFQCIFWIASYPMDWIDLGFSFISIWLNNVLPVSWWSDLLINGLLSGLNGIIIFIPQIAILYFLITVLEDSGYMSRVSFLMDKVFQSSGLSGKSLMPIMSGMACAIPAVMAARTIENRKQRLITILVTPFMSCSARLPIYTIMIALVIPEKYFGIIGLQGLVLMGMYILGFVTALVVAKILSTFMFKREKSFFVLELPVYQVPRWKNAIASMVEKSKVFMFEAGKIIMIISVILWFMSSYGPQQRMRAVDEEFDKIAMSQNASLSPENELAYRAKKLENSYAGILGKFIEPAIEPLGFDWKVGIALISSFAAREVFVGTMATLYSIGEDGNSEATLKQQLKNEKRPDGSPFFDLATGLSLMIFYAYAMQCMSTVAVVKRETGGWSFALFQLFFMTGIAYIASLLVYQLIK